MKESKRQTDLSFEELIEHIENHEASCYPPCLILNEVGVAMEEDPSVSVRAKAEAFLVKILNSTKNELDLRCIAYMFLTLSEKQSEEAKKVIEAFRKENPAAAVFCDMDVEDQRMKMIET